MRNDGLSPDDPDTLDKFKKSKSSPMAIRSPEQRAQDLGDALNWLRNKGKDDDANDATGEFRNFDSMLPRKRGQSPADRAREIEGALDWMRSNGVSPDDPTAFDKFNKAGSIPVTRRSPEL
jgi:hypothetical protein